MGTFATQHTPPNPGPEIPIERVKGNDQKCYVVLSPALWGVWTHWAGDRSEPCYSEKKDCPGCKKGLPRRWKGYLHVFNRQTGREAFAELTPLSAENLLAQVPDGSHLRGLRLTLKRTAARNGRLVVLLDPGVQQIPRGIEAKDPCGVLCKLWGVSLADRAGPKDALRAVFPEHPAQTG
jgi:hypothetical protein